MGAWFDGVTERSWGSTDKNHSAVGQSEGGLNSAFQAEGVAILVCRLAGFSL